MRKALVMLGELSDGDIEWIARCGERQIFSSGKTLITQGVDTKWLFILLDGLATVNVSGHEVARLASGEILGEISMIDKQPPTATVTADIETTAIAIDKMRLAKKLNDDGAFAGRFYRAVAIFLADRLRATNMRLARGGTAPTAEEQDLADELSEDVLDKVYLAGAKFDKLLKHSLKAD
jgi:CRP-like cAMP-binding protein